MKIKNVFFSILILIIAFFLIQCSALKTAEKEGGYKQADTLAYYLFTDKDIRYASQLLPEAAYFTYTAQDGTQSEESSIVYYNGYSQLPKIRKYLTALGYSVAEKSRFTESWTKKNQTLPYFYIFINRETLTLTLTKVIR